MLNKLMMDDGLPGEETFLINKTSMSSGKTFALTIPSNVKVIKVYTSANYTCYGENDYDGYTDLSNNIPNAAKKRITWQHTSGRYITKATTTYIGVTAGKQYTLYTLYMGATIHNFSISYSASINQQTPSVTDY